MNSAANKVVCNRCGGAGTTVHVHIAGGTCFACGGTGHVAFNRSSADDLPELPDFTAAERLEILRETYRAATDPARKNGPRGWFVSYGLGAGGGTAARPLAQRLLAVDATTRAKASAAFAKILGADLWSQVEAEMVRRAA